jgi:hypothetical protein
LFSHIPIWQYSPPFLRRAIQIHGWLSGTMPPLSIKRNPGPQRMRRIAGWSAYGFPSYLKVLGSVSDRGTECKGCGQSAPGPLQIRRAHDLNHGCPYLQQTIANWIAARKGSRKCGCGRMGCVRPRTILHAVCPCFPDVAHTVYSLVPVQFPKNGPKEFKRNRSCYSFWPKEVG